MQPAQIAALPSAQPPTPSLDQALSHAPAPAAAPVPAALPDASEALLAARAACQSSMTVDGEARAEKQKRASPGAASSPPTTRQPAAEPPPTVPKPPAKKGRTPRGPTSLSTAFDAAAVRPVDASNYHQVALARAAAPANGSDPLGRTAKEITATATAAAAAAAAAPPPAPGKLNTRLKKLRADLHLATSCSDGFVLPAAADQQQAASRGQAFLEIDSVLKLDYFADTCDDDKTKAEEALLLGWGDRRMGAIDEETYAIILGFLDRRA